MTHLCENPYPVGQELVITYCPNPERSEFKLGDVVQAQSEKRIYGHQVVGARAGHADWLYQEIGELELNLAVEDCPPHIASFLRQIRPRITLVHPVRWMRPLEDPDEDLSQEKDVEYVFGLPVLGEVT